jgi:hypothetical protein
MSYGTNTSIGNISDDTFKKNIDNVVDKVKLGLTTFDKEISIRLNEISRIYLLKSYHSRTSKNNKRRANYIDKEIAELIKIREEQCQTSSEKSY